MKSIKKLKPQPEKLSQIIPFPFINETRDPAGAKIRTEMFFEFFPYNQVQSKVEHFLKKKYLRKNVQKYLSKRTKAYKILPLDGNLEPKKILAIFLVVKKF